MDRKQLVTAAVVCGLIAVLGVLLPWYSISSSVDTSSLPQGAMHLPGMAGAHQSQSFNGTQGDFNGTFVLILALVGAAAAGLVAARRTDVFPLDERQHLFVAAGLFGIAVIVTLTDVFRAMPGMSTATRIMKIEAGKSFGLYLTLAATLAATAAAWLATQKPTAPVAAAVGDEGPDAGSTP